MNPLAGLVARRAPPGVWGDGFDADTWRDLSIVRSWDACSDEEMIRVFPLLTRQHGRLSSRLLQRISDCVAALTWRASQRRDGLYTPVSIDMNIVKTRGRELARCWFADPAVRRGLFARRPAFPALRESSALVLIDSLADELATGNPRAFAGSDAADFVYWTGVHPVYVWPAALLDHAFYTAVGWLGHAKRSSRALMTPDIAEYFVSVLREAHGGNVVTTVPGLVPYLDNGNVAKVVLRTARRHVGGRSAMMRWPPRTMFKPTFSSLGQPALLAE